MKKLRQIVEETVSRKLREAISRDQRKEIETEVAREVLGTDSFDEFYSNTGFMVGGRDYYLMSQYFKVLAKRIEEIELGQK